MLIKKTDQDMQHQNRTNGSVPPAPQTEGSGWKQTARELFFDSGCSVVQIAAYTGVSRQSIAAYLKGCAGYAAERDRRRAASQAARKEYKKAKNREYRAAGMEVTAETMRREHDTAALILSRERYHN
ncbi:MAG: hypothetical protein NC409_12550 [Clostridium sp.]|nr:hypothetical protein [Clostridium sp.]